MIAFALVLAGLFLAATIAIAAVSYALRLACFCVEIVCRLLLGVIAVVNWLRPPPPPGFHDLTYNRLRRRWE